MADTSTAESVLWGAALFATAGGAIWLAHWMAPPRDISSRPIDGRRCDPQSEPARTGVDGRPLSALPRSPQTPAVEDPRPSAAGLDLPVGGVVAAPHPPAGLQRRRVILHG